MVNHYIFDNNMIVNWLSYVCVYSPKDSHVTREDNPKVIEAVKT